MVTLELTDAGQQVIKSAAMEYPQGILQHAIFCLPEQLLIELYRNLEVLVHAMGILDKSAASEPIHIDVRTDPSKTGS